MEWVFNLKWAEAQQVFGAIWMQLPLALVGLAAIALFYVLGRVVRWTVRRSLRRQDPTLARMLSGLVFLGFVIFGILVAFWITLPTINFREIFAGLGVTGIILGFALKDIIENFVAGILILWRRPFRVGDQIRSGSHEGTVEEINFRSTILQTYDGIRVYIPNGKVFTETLENLTGYQRRRTTVTFGIDQNASVAKARHVILDRLQSVVGVLPEPKPLVLFDAVGNFANNVHVLYWTQPPTRFSEIVTKSDVTEALFTALQDAGISFPYPIQTVHLDRANGQSQPSNNSERASRGTEAAGQDGGAAADSVGGHQMRVAE